MKSLIPRRENKSIGLIGHSIIGFPNLEVTKKLVAILVEQGADLIELQIPFSEPIADGPLFTRANFDALSQGITVDTCMNLMHELTTIYSIPFVFMTYANVVFRRGFESFVIAAKQAGARGAIIPDLPIDLADEYLTACQKHDFAAIQIIPPNITDQRLPGVCKAAQGFIYAVARTGVTGEKTELGQPVADLLTKIRNHTNLPVAVGFGITTKQDLEFLAPYADYAVIGTQTLRVYQEKGLEGVADFWRELKK